MWFWCHICQDTQFIDAQAGNPGIACPKCGGDFVEELGSDYVPEANSSNQSFSPIQNGLDAISNLFSGLPREISSIFDGTIVRNLQINSSLFAGTAARETTTVNENTDSRQTTTTTTQRSDSPLSPREVLERFINRISGRNSPLTPNVIQMEPGVNSQNTTERVATTTSTGSSIPQSSSSTSTQGGRWIMRQNVIRNTQPDFVIFGYHGGEVGLDDSNLADVNFEPNSNAQANGARNLLQVGANNRLVHMLAALGLPILARNPVGGDYVFDQAEFDSIISRLMETQTTTHGVPDNILEKIPKQKMLQFYIDEGLECTICQEKFEYDQEVTRLSCDHFFHVDCLLPWLKTSPTCPTCRNTIVPSFFGEPGDSF